jgi:hypothetical protein
MSAKNKCIICGKKAKRHCPALDHFICSLCCGTKRGIDIDCSPQCQFFPFAVPGYDLWLKLDGTAPPKLAERIVSEFGPGHFKKVLDLFSDKDRSEELDLEFRYHMAINHLLMVEKDEDGRTLAEKWEAEDWQGLAPGEALMMKYRGKSFVTIIEIQKILDHQRMECIDLFDPEQKPFIVLDRSTTPKAIRFTRLFGWLTHYPNFSRPGVTQFILPQVIRREFIYEIIDRCELSTGRSDEEALKDYMAAHLSDLIQLIWAMPGEKIREIFRNMDSHQCVAEYSLEAPREEIEDLLESKPDFDWDDREPEEGDPPGTDYYIWHRTGESRELEKEMTASFRHDPGSGQVGIVGNLKITDDSLILETLTRRTYEFAQKMLLKYFRDKIKFRKEMIIDLARQIAENDLDETIQSEQPPPPSQKEIPPEIEAELMKNFYRDRYTKFPDEEVPALNGLTPRQAAADPASRPLLLDLMKEHLNGIESMNRKKGFDINIDFALRELGLEELIDPPN